MRTICGTILAVVCTMGTAFPAALETLPVPNEDKAYGELYGRIVERIRLWPEHLGLDLWKCVIFRRLVCFCCLSAKNKIL